MTPGQASAAVKQLGIEKDKEVPNGIRRMLSGWRNVVMKGYQARGIGRAVWAEKKLTTLREIVKRERVVRVGEGWQAGLSIRGMAALMESGGRTLPHSIKSSSGKLWQHPGGRVPQVPAARDSVYAAEALLAVEMDKALTKAIKSAGLYSD